MRRWIGLTLFAVVLLGGAFGVSALAIEWRQETTDLGPVTAEVAELRTDVEEIRSLLEATPAPTPTPVLTPTPTPVPEEVVTLEVGAVAVGGGIRLTVEALSHEAELIPGIVEGVGSAEFILENVDAPPADTFPLSVTTVDGFSCRTGGELGGGGPLQPGEKTRLKVIWDCPDAKTLTIGSVQFEFP